MNGAFHIGAIGLGAQQRALDTLAGNISNINTPGFKRSSVRFSEVLAGRADPAALRADLGDPAAASAGVRSEALFLLGKAYIAIKEPDRARKVWQQLVEEFPNDSRSAEARSRLSRLSG